MLFSVVKLRKKNWENYVDKINVHETVSSLKLYRVKTILKVMAVLLMLLISCATNGTSVAPVQRLIINHVITMIIQTDFTQSNMIPF